MLAVSIPTRFSIISENLVDSDLYVSSFNSNEVLRYDGESGEFIDAFVTSGDGDLQGPCFLIFSEETPIGKGGGCSLGFIGTLTPLPLYFLIPIFILIRRLWRRYMIEKRY